MAVHGRCLERALRSLGLSPVILGPKGLKAELPEASVVEMARRMPKALEQAKWLWPTLIGRLASRLHKGQEGPYILHGLSNFNIPLAHLPGKCRKVLTVHDLIPIIAPSQVSWALAKQMAVLMPRALEAADRVVCVSNWTYQSIAERYPRVVGKCMVVPNGVDVLNLEQESRVAARAQLDGPIRLLYVARYEPYKQHTVLLNLLRKTGGRYQLTLITDAKGVAFCAKNAADLIKCGLLAVDSGVSADELRIKYREAQIYVQPSLYEGYCLPAAEALGSGLPVVYTPGTAVGELVGDDLGIGVSSASAAAWDEGLQKALAMYSQKDFSNRLKDSWRRLPTWEKAAKALKTLYNELIEFYPQ